MIHSEAPGPVVVLTIDRPERRNALDHEALDGLAAALAACGDDVRALVLTGAGGHFCAGADLHGVEDAAFADRLRGTSKMSSRIVVEALALVTWWGLRDRLLRRRP